KFQLCQRYGRYTQAPVYFFLEASEHVGRFFLHHIDADIGVQHIGHSACLSCWPPWSLPSSNTSSVKPSTPSMKVFHRDLRGTRITASPSCCTTTSSTSTRN